MTLCPDDIAVNKGGDRAVRIAVPGWGTGVPGLVVTAGIGDAYGDYVLTHERSGFTLYHPSNGACWRLVTEAAAAAQRLAGLCDWTMDWEAVTSAVLESKDAVLAALAGEPAK